MTDPRYSRQEILRIFSPGDFEKIRNSGITIVGVGGTGSMAADMFARAGVKSITLVDRDYVSISNLHRQVLYGDADVGEPKAEVAKRRLQYVNPDVDVRIHIKTFDASNAEEIISGSDLVYDGTDNFTSRLIINDACVKLGIPWIYTSAIETYGEVKAVIPGKTSCLSCYVTMPSKRQPACSEVGVFPSLPSMISSFAFSKAVRVLTGKEERGDLTFFDIWGGEVQSLKIKKSSTCRTCAEGKFDYLSEKFSFLGIRPLI